MVEFDSPQKLLQIADGFFRRLVEEHGEQETTNSNNNTQQYDID